MTPIVFAPKGGVCKICKRYMNFGTFPIHMKKFHLQEFVECLKEQEQKIEKEMMEMNELA